MKADPAKVRELIATLQASIEHDAAATAADDLLWQPLFNKHDGNPANDDFGRDAASVSDQGRAETEIGDAGRSYHRDKRLPDDTSDRTSTAMDRDLMDAKIAASEARTDAKFSELTGKFDRLSDKLDAMAGTLSTMREDNRETRSTVRTWSLGIAALVLAVPGVLFGAFDLGEKHRAVVPTPAPIVIQAQPMPVLPAPAKTPAAIRSR